MQRRHVRNDHGRILDVAETPLPTCERRSTLAGRLSDAWVWDMFRPARFVKPVRVITFKDVNIEEVEKPELRLPD